MKITVKVKPKSSRNEVVQNTDGTITVFVSVPPADGLANERVIELVSAFYKKPKRAVSIMSGHRGKNKIIEIE